MSARTAATRRIVSPGEPDLETGIRADDVVLAGLDTKRCGACRGMTPRRESIAADTDATLLAVDITSHLETAIEYSTRHTPPFVRFVAGRPVKQRRETQTGTVPRNLVERYREAMAR